MPAGDLILGGITATDWQIPGKIGGLGGKHRIAVTKLFGGQRVLDALGPDDDEITWAGRFRGPTALLNAQTWDAMRSSGAQIPLFMVGMFRLVVIGQFSYVVEKPYEVTYSIKCIVASNPMQGLLNQAIGSLSDIVSADMNSISGLIS